MTDSTHTGGGHRRSRRWAYTALALVLAAGLAMPFAASTGLRAASVSSAGSALPVDGIAAVGWGYNGAGAVGDSTTTSRLSPVGVSGFANGVKQVASTWTHSLGLLSDGTVWAWGDNQNGQLGDGSQDNRAAPVRVPLSNVTQVAAGYGFSLALRSDGTVWGWGDDSFAELGDGSITSTPRLSPVQVSGLSGVTQIAAGEDFAMALLSDRTVRTWGLNGFGQLGIGSGRPDYSTVPLQVPGLTGVTQIAAGAQFGLALLSDGTVRAWGENTNGYLGDGTTTSRFAPVAVTGLTGVTQVAGGSVHSLAVLSDGTIRTWGSNVYGQLGDGTTVGHLTPAPVPGLAGVVQIAGGILYSLAVLSDGTVRAWGYNGQGFLGLVTGGPQQLTPAPVSGLAHVQQVSAGYGFSLAKLAVPGFSIALDTQSAMVTPNDSVAVIMTLTAVNGFTASAALGATGLPNGVTASFSPSQVSATGPATLTLSTSAGSPAGDFLITITATSTSAADPVKTATFDLNVSTGLPQPDSQ